MLIEKRPIEHFKELVSSAIRHQKVQTNELAEFYLSNLLADFVNQERLSEEPLAITFMKALEMKKESQGIVMKHLGDLSLFVSGYFSDSLKRKIVDIDYYILMGVTSYGYLADLHKEKTTLASLFEELANKFRAFVDVLSEVSERCGLVSDKDILRLYERWLKTKSKHTENLLKNLGINPVDTDYRSIH